MAHKFMEELRKLSDNTNLLGVHISNALQDRLGLEVGTRENLLEVVRFTEEYINQIESAINSLDSAKHEFPIDWLGSFQASFEKIRSEAEKCLFQGDYYVPKEKS